MTLKRQSVQSLSDHKAARAFLRKPRRRVRRNSRGYGLEQNKMVVPFCLEQRGAAGEGRGERDWGENRKISLKNTIENDKEKMKERKQERKKIAV